jgi:hypothetical protein
LSRRPRIAAVVTEYRKHSHGQHIVDRFLEGYGWNNRHHRPEMDVVSLYVDQRPEGDLTQDRISRFPQMKLCDSIATALTLGTDDLAVDGVVLIAEHGQYERNEKGQHLYPRYEFFMQIVDVFRATGKTAAVFNDKHLSWNWNWAREMYEVSRELDFPFMAGSSLPVTWRNPAIDMPLDARIEEAMCVGYGDVDSYDFHAFETLQCMVERRAGGEAGVHWLETYSGDRFWQAHHDGLWSRDLFDACLCRSHSLTSARDGFNHTFPNVDEQKRLAEPLAFRYQHADGLPATVIMMNGLVQDFNFAARLEGMERPLSTQMYLPMPPKWTTLASFFSPQVNNVEQMFLTGVPAYPVERTLLTTGLVIAGVDSLQQEGARVATPHLDISYPAPSVSTFWDS